MASSLFLCVPQKAPSMPPSARCPHYTNHAHRCKRANPDWLGYSHLVIPEANPRCYTDWNLRNIFVNQREKSNPGGVLSPYLVYQANATSHFPPISYALSNDIFLLSIHSFHRGVKQSLCIRVVVCICMFSHTYCIHIVCTYYCACEYNMYGSQDNTGYLPRLISTLLAKAISFPKLKAHLFNWSSYLASFIHGSHLHSPSARIKGGPQHPPGIYIRVRDPNVISHVHTANTLWAELSLQASRCFFYPRMGHSAWGIVYD